MNTLKLADTGQPDGLWLPGERLEADGLLLVIIGASAVGKSTSAAHLCDEGIVEATPTWTTRPRRPNEIEAPYDHHFVSEEVFDRYEAEGGFIDQKAFYGARYGVPYPKKPAPGLEALMVLKPTFIPAVLKQYPYTRIYLMEASPRLLPERMRERGQSEKDIEERMGLHPEEVMDARRYAHVVFNNNGLLEHTLQALEFQIQADRTVYNTLRKAQA